MLGGEAGHSQRDKDVLGVGVWGGRPQPAAEGSASQGHPGLRHPRLESARPSPDRSQSRPLKVSGTSHVSPHLTPNKKAQGMVLLLLFSCSVTSSSFVIPWAAIHQAPLSMGFPRQEYWSGIFPTKRSNPGLLHWQADSLPLSPQGRSDGLAPPTLSFSPPFTAMSPRALRISLTGFQALALCSLCLECCCPRCLHGTPPPETFPSLSIYHLYLLTLFSFSLCFTTT